MERGLVSDIQKFSIHDGPGIRTVVFLKGCPLKCLWCSNPETQNKEPEIMYSEEFCIQCQRCVYACKLGAIEINNFSAGRLNRDKCIGCGDCVQVCPSKALVLRGTRMSVDDILFEVEKDAQFYRSSRGGITISGGEPLFQVKFLEKLLKECKKRNIHTAIETTGFAKWQDINRIINYIDLFLYDIKIVESHQHFCATGVTNKIILENLQRIVNQKKDVILRVPLIPQYTATNENLNEIAKMAQKLGITDVHILPYHNYGEKKYKKVGKEYSLHNTNLLENEQVEEFRSLFSRYGLEVIVV